MNFVTKEAKRRSERIEELEKQKYEIMREFEKTLSDYFGLDIEISQINGMTASGKHGVHVYKGIRKLAEKYGKHISFSDTEIGAFPVEGMVEIEGTIFFEIGVNEDAIE